MRLYAANILTREAINTVGDHLKDLDFSDENLLEKEDLGIGMNTWASISALEEEYDTAPFFNAVMKFYIATITKMIKKFPFGDTLLQDLGILVPDKVATYSVDTVVRLARRFPQLELCDPTSLDQLREEFLDFTLSPTDLPTQTEYSAADKSKKPCIGKYWWEVSKIVTLHGQPRFPLLFKLMAGLLTIPASNADSERGFSMLRKIHTDQRSNLNQSTIIALMSLKLNSDSCCYNSELSEDLLKCCKKATNKFLSSSSSS